MSRVTMFAGLDYHQDSIQVCVMDAGGKVLVNRPCVNDLEALAGMLRSAGEVGAVSLEACCGAADLGEKLAGCGNWQVSLAHAGYVSRLKGSPDKTDFSDARLLADLTRVGYLPRVWLAPRELRDLRQLVAHRQGLVNQRRDVKLQIGALLREQRVKVANAGRWSRRWVSGIREHALLSEDGRWIIGQKLAQIEQLDQWIAYAEKKLAEASSKHALADRLGKIEGVGKVTCWMLLAYVGRFDRFKNGKQLARYCGLSPRNSSSGKQQADAGLIDACRKSLRAVLIQAAHSLVRNHRQWKALWERMRACGKPKNLVVAAVANRWIRSLHHRMILAEQAA